MTNTPSEGTSAPELAGFSTEQRRTVELIVAEALAAQARQTQVRAAAAEPSRARRIAGRAVPVAAVAGVAAMTEPGQQAVGAIGDAGQYVGGQAAEAGRDIAGAASDAYDASVQGVSDAYNASVEGIENAYNASVDQIQETAHDVAEGAANAWHGFTGWATDAAAQAWGVTQDVYHAVADPLVTAGQHVGQFASQYADQVAANPANTAVTAALAAGAVVAATPQLREAVGKAAAATSRFAGAAVSEVTERAHNAYLGAKVAFDKVRANPRIQGALKAVGLGSKETHTAVTEANAVTSAQTQLPKTAEVKAGLVPGQDPSQVRAGSKPPVAAEAGQSTGTGGQGAAERTGAATDPNKGKNGPSQGI